MEHIFHLSIPVLSLSKTKEFFVNAFNSKIVVEKAEYTNIDFFGHQLTVHESSKIDHNGIDFHFGVNLSYEKFDEIIETIYKKYPESVKLAPKIVDEGLQTERKKAFIKSPSGYLIELKARK